MNTERAIEALTWIKDILIVSAEYKKALDMAIEALKAKCPTCKRCSDHQESGTRCPIEEHYALPKDGFCHLYEPYKAESEEV